MADAEGLEPSVNGFGDHCFSFKLRNQNLVLVKIKEYFKNSLIFFLTIIMYFPEW